MYNSHSFYNLGTHIVQVCHHNSQVLHYCPMLHRTMEVILGPIPILVSCGMCRMSQEVLSVFIYPTACPMGCAQNLPTPSTEPSPIHIVVSGCWYSVFIYAF